jgi:hypothetical protein
MPGLFDDLPSAGGGAFDDLPNASAETRSAVLSRPGVKLDNGQTATVRSIGVGDERGEWVIPTVVNGKIVSNDEAIQLWKAGKNEPIGGPFKSVAEANDYAERFHQAEAKRIGGAFDDLPDRPSAIQIEPRAIPRDGMELAAQNFRGEEAVRKSLAELPREASLEDNRSAPEKWWEEFKNSEVGRNIFGNPGAEAGGDIEREGALSTLASIPARVGTTTGRLAKAGVADLATAMRNDKSPEGDFGGNIEAALRKDETLPIERALQLSHEDDRDRHIVGWQTISGDIALGLADLAPKIAMLEAAPGGMLAKSGAAADIFGFDEHNKFQPKSAAFAAAFPFVTKAAAAATDKAIANAVERGFDWAGKPGAQRALHVAANQAAMDAVMVAQSAPELGQLAATDPQEFKRQLAKIIGSNLAFAIPEAMKDFAPVVRDGANPESPKTESVPVTRDLAAELEASMRGNQVKAEPAAGTKPDVSDQSATIADSLKLNRVYQAQQEIQKSAVKQEAKATDSNLNQNDSDSTAKIEVALTEADSNETTKPDAVAETITGQNEQTGSEATRGDIAREPMPAEGSKLPTAASASPKRKSPFSLRARSDGVPDILDSIQELGGLRPPGEYSGGEYNGFREAMTGPARMLVRKGATHAPDTLIDELKAIGAPGAERIETADDLWDAVRSAVKNRDALRKQEQAQTAEGKQFREFQQRALQGQRPKSERGKTERIPVGQLLEGDNFEVQNHKFEVKHLEFDEAGNLAFVEVKDGPKFGVQRIGPGEAEFIHVDRNTFREGPNHDGGEVPRATPPIPSNAAIGGETKGAPLELKETPKAYQGRESDLEQISQDLYGKPYDELPESDKGKVQVTLDAEDRNDPLLQGREQPEKPSRGNADNPGERTGQGGSAEQPGRVRPAATKAASREAVAQEIYRRPYEVLSEEAQAAVRRQITEGRSAGTKQPTAIDERLFSMQDEILRLREDLFHAPRDKSNTPQTSRGVGILAQIRHIEGQMDMLREIASADPKLKAEWFKKFLDGDPPDAIERTLDTWIAWTSKAQGRLLEGVTGAPIWLTKSTLDGALRVIRAAYQGGKKLVDAIEDGVAWLREQKLEDFSEDEAREFLANSARNADPVIQRLPDQQAEISRVVDELDAAETERSKLKARSEAIPSELTERIAALTDRFRELKNWNTEPSPEPAKPAEAETAPEKRAWQTVETEMLQASEALRATLKKNWDAGVKKAGARQEQALAAAKYRTLKAELVNHPDYVADLLTRHEASVNAGESGKAEAEELKTKLEEIPPKLLNRVHEELQKKGTLSKLSPAPPAGRSLDDLTDWLKAAGVDSPKRSLRERLALGQKVADRWNAIKDATEQARLKLGLAWKTALESIKHPPIDTGFRNVIKDWKFMDEWTGQQTSRWIRTINEAVENPTRQMALSVWLDAGGDQSLLRYQAAAVPERYAGIWQTALELTPKEKDLALRIKRDFEDKLNDGKNSGLIEKGREDYGVPQLWKKPPEPLNDQTFATATGPKGSPGNWKAKLDPRDPFFSFQRTHPTYFEGIQAGGVPQSLRISDLVAVYNTAFHKSLSSRSAIWALKNENAADGLPIVKISGGARQVSGPDAGTGTYFVDSKARSQSDAAVDGRPYRPLDHFAMRDWKVAYKTSDGKTVMVRGDMLIHPDHYEFLKNELGQSALREGAVGRVMNPILKANSFIKASKLALGTFHLATIGEHAIFHWVNPFTKGFQIDLRQPDQALLVRNGLELGMSGPQMAFEEGLASHGGLFDKVPFVGDASRKFSDWLFKDYIPALSVKAGLEVLKRNRQRYGKELSDSQIAELTAHQMNAAFGLQNYRLLGRNKTLLDLNRMALLAPQFLYSRAKVVGQALKPYGAEQRRMLIWQAATLYVGSRILNSLLDDDPHWEAENAFSVIYNKRAYSIRTIVGDFWHLLMDPKSFASGRLSPLARLGFETLSQRDLRTGARKEPPIQTEWVPGRVSQNLVVDLAKWMLPVGSEGVLPGAAGREQSPVGSLLGSVGIGSHKYTAQTQIWQWAADFNRESEDPGTRTYQRHRDAAVKGEGAYRKLDALLDAGRFDDAQQEYEELQADGHKPENIKARYHRSMPFTGSAERERAFKASLDPKQLAIYERALQERKERDEKFKQMLELAPLE